MTKSLVTLIVYMPAINRQYVKWIRKHKPDVLHLIPKDIAVQFLPNLDRNIIALTAYEALVMIRGMFPEVTVVVATDPISLESCVMPDEDLSRLLVDGGFVQSDQIEFESIRARWDMKEVLAQQPVIADVEVVEDEFSQSFMSDLTQYAKKSPDWFRQIAAAVKTADGKTTLTACNTHMPDEYEAAIHGDLRINFDAGEPAGFGKYLSIHAEMAVLAECLKHGIVLKGASFWSTVFPCSNCARMLALTGIETLYFKEGYSIIAGQEVLQAAGIRIIQVI